MALKKFVNEKGELFPRFDGTRVVQRPTVEAKQEYEPCTGCGEKIKFLGAAALKKSPHERGVVIVNLVLNGAWQGKVDTFHPDCYRDAGMPFGEPTVEQWTPNNARQKATVSTY